jgi:serine/threonine-protein kinase
VTDPTVDPDRWERIQQITHAALEHDPPARGAFIEEACGGDRELRAEVDALLLARQQEEMDDSPYGAAPRLELLRDDLAERYDVLRLLGSGGMATVYLAHDLKHNRNVAIKVLRPALAATLGGERFLREIEIAAGLQHPHILPLYDSGALGSILYYVMPYVEGSTLHARIARGALPAPEAVQVAADVLSALEYAHQRGIVHRDIKPANILLSASGGHALVADFGIARAVSAAGPGTGPGKLTVPGAMIGTPGYMAPEQVAGLEVTPATDIYAVGVVLYECLTGRSWSPAERLQKSDWRGVPASVLPALKRALAWAPEQRWPDAATFRTVLLGPVQRLRGSRRRFVALVAAVTVTLGVVLTGLWLRRDGSAPVTAISRVAVLPFTVRGGTEFAYLAEGMVDLLATKLDGAGTWRSVDPRLVLGVTEREGAAAGIDPRAGRDIAEQLSADLFVLGNVVQVGEQLRLDASLYDRADEEEALVQASVEGPVDSVLALLDDMAAELLAAQPGAAGARLSRIALVTSSSLPALKAYLRGVTQMRAAQYQAAADAFQAAITADSAFALAWYQLGVAADWLLVADLAREATRQALRYADRLSDRDRLLLEARGSVVIEAAATDAEGRYRTILGRYPTDVEAWSQLGELLLHWGTRLGQPLEAAREPWTRLLELEPDRADALVHLARIEAGAGNEAALDEMVRRVSELAPEGDRLLEMRLLQAYVRGDAQAEQRVLADFRQASDGTVAEAAWSASSYIDDLGATAALASILAEDTRSSDTRVVGYGVLASVALARGQWATATEALDSMARLNPVGALEQRTMLAATTVGAVDSAALETYRAELSAVDWTNIPPGTAPGVWYTALDSIQAQLAQYLIGLASARLGDTAAALAAAAALERLGTPDGHGSVVRDWARAVRATAAWRSGNVDAALGDIDQFEGQVWYQLATASLYHSQAYERYLRASLLEETGRLEESLRWYGSFEATGLHDLIFLAPSHWRRGHVYQQLGDAETAQAHYLRFLELWSEADAAFRPMLDDARQQLDSQSGAVRSQERTARGVA